MRMLSRVVRLEERGKMMYGHEREVKKKMNVYFKPEKKQHSATTPLAFILLSLKAFGKASYKGVTLRNACNAQKREDTSYFMQLIIFSWFHALQESARKELLTSHRSGEEGRTHSLDGLQTTGLCAWDGAAIIHGMAMTLVKSAQVRSPAGSVFQAGMKPLSPAGRNSSKEKDAGRAGKGSHQTLLLLPGPLGKHEGGNPGKRASCARETQLCSNKSS